METHNIKQNFFDLDSDLIESPIREKLTPLRDNFKSEIGGPGCTPCKMNSAKRKYENIIDQMMDEHRAQEKLEN